MEVAMVVWCWKSWIDDGMAMHVKIAKHYVTNVAGEFSIYLKSNAIFSSTDSKERKFTPGPRIWV